MYYEKIQLKTVYDFLGKNDCNPTVTVYLPNNLWEMNRGHLKKQCMIVCPGGGYDNCSQREAEVIGTEFLNEGYNVFVINYSGRGHSFPTQICEMAAVLDLIHNNAEAWNCDVEKIAAIGFSAGAHLVAHYSNRFDCAEVRSFFPNSYPLNAAILSYPVITAIPELCNRDSIVRVSGSIEITDEVVNNFSCELMVTEKTPPTFIWHTVADHMVPVENSLLYASALQKNKVPFELQIYPYGLHGLATVDERTNNELDEKVKLAADWIPSVKKWLKVIL